MLESRSMGPTATLTPSHSCIPLHMLPSYSSGHMHQARYFSSSTCHAADDLGPQNSEGGNHAQQAGSSLFSFQSLGSLVQQAAQGRYSRPKKVTSEDASGTTIKNDIAEKSNEGPVIGASSAPQQRSEVSVSVHAHQTLPDARTSVDPAGELPLNFVNAHEPVDIRIRKHMVSDSKLGDVEDIVGSGSAPAWTVSDQKPIRNPTKAKSRRDQARTYARVQNPFQKEPDDQSLQGRAARLKQLEKKDVEGSAWGVDTQSPDRHGSARNAVRKSPSHATVDHISVTQADHQSQLDKAESHNKLTHLNSSGEARMVDVGGKASTKRVAIASSCVRFSNPEAYRLILENGNKKGDVLGVARTAGIMAAKRTSEVIPLCHPISITKVSVDLELQAPSNNHRMWTGNVFGLVDVRAQVECTGPTGVEMEALMAVSGATLTVYDMCKAVDRDMRISTTRVVYKSGGASGLFAHRVWSEAMGGQEWFEERGLEVPHFEVNVGKDGAVQGPKPRLKGRRQGRT